jgi:hypothetical protein
MKALLEGKAIPSFDETPEEHLRRCHPDPAETARERAELERRLQAQWNKETPK